MTVKSAFNLLESDDGGTSLCKLKPLWSTKPLSCPLRIASIPPSQHSLETGSMQRDLQKQCVCVLVHLCQPLCSPKLWKVVKARQNLLQVAYKQVQKCFILICSGEGEAGAQQGRCPGLSSCSDLLLRAGLAKTDPLGTRGGFPSPAAPMVWGLSISSSCSTLQVFSSCPAVPENRMEGYKAGGNFHCPLETLLASRQSGISAP